MVRKLRREKETDSKMRREAGGGRKMKCQLLQEIKKVSRGDTSENTKKI